MERNCFDVIISSWDQREEYSFSCDQSIYKARVFKRIPGVIFVRIRKNRWWRNIARRNKGGQRAEIEVRKSWMVEWYRCLCESKFFAFSPFTTRYLHRVEWTVHVYVAYLPNILNALFPPFFPFFLFPFFFFFGGRKQPAVEFHVG